jgi:glycosyltransferase involved in cell wall biosynthesis
MTAYDAEATLVESVESVLAQTVPDLELIVVDDGSRDGTAGILARQADPRVRVLTQENTGIAGALNAGITAARGRFIARMDADDRSLPTRLEAQLDAFAREPELALVGTSFFSIDAAGRRLDLVPTLLANDELRRDLFVRCPFGHGSVVVRREALIDAGQYDSSAVPAEDYDLWRRLMTRHRVANVPEALYEYRVHDGNTAKERSAAAAASVRDRVWADGPPEPPSAARVARDVRTYLACGELGWALAEAYVRQHLTLLTASLAHGHALTALRLLPFVALAPVVAVRGLVRRARRQLSPIAPKMAAKRAR